MRVSLNTRQGTVVAELSGSRLAYRGSFLSLGSSITVDGTPRTITKILPSAYVPGVMIAYLD